MSADPANKEKWLKIVGNYISRMPSFSTTVTKVLKICNDPATSPNDLNRVISLDPVLTGQVLKLINSAYYSLPNKVTSLTRAIVMLGLNTVKNLAVSTAVVKGMANKASFQVLSMDDFWTHSLCVGVAAKALATVKGIPVTDREEYFVGGLLHDLGKIPLNNRFSSRYVSALEMARNEQGTLHRAEDMIFGFDHCLVGKMIAEKWQLGESMNESLCYHHGPQDAKDENRQMVEIVALANTFTNALQIGSSGDPVPEDTVLAHLIEQVGVEQSALSDLRETVMVDIEKAKIFLQVTEKG
jgi:HD-like signal output (HDOD) protein